MKGRKLTGTEVADIQRGLTYLRLARELLRTAGAHRAAEYVGRSIKSAEGAERHAKGRASRPRCADCGAEGERTGHITCQYPKNRE